MRIFIIGCCLLNFLDALSDDHLIINKDDPSMEKLTEEINLLKDQLLVQQDLLRLQQEQLLAQQSKIVGVETEVSLLRDGAKTNGLLNRPSISCKLIVLV